MAGWNESHGNGIYMLLMYLTSDCCVIHEDLESPAYKMNNPLNLSVVGNWLSLSWNYKLGAFTVICCD